MIPYFNVNLPKNLWIFLKSLGWVNFSFVQRPLELIHNLWGYHYDQEKGGVFYKFEDLGYDDRFAKNCGSFFFSILLYVLTLHFVLSMLCFSKKKTAIKRFARKLLIYVNFSALFRVLYLSYF